MPGWIAQPGLILFTENYDACLAFYRDVLELEVLHSQPGLTRFAFGSGYLMVERGGVARKGGKSMGESPVTLRFNVADIDTAIDMLRERGVEVEVHTWTWGVTGHFLDPDGNRCELKDPFRT